MVLLGRREGEGVEGRLGGRGRRRQARVFRREKWMHEELHSDRLSAILIVVW